MDFICSLIFALWHIVHCLGMWTAAVAEESRQELRHTSASPPLHSPPPPPTNRCNCHHETNSDNSLVAREQRLPCVCCCYVSPLDCLSTSLYGETSSPVYRRRPLSLSSISSSSSSASSSSLHRQNSLGKYLISLNIIFLFINTSCFYTYFF